MKTAKGMETCFFVHLLCYSNAEDGQKAYTNFVSYFVLILKQSIFIYMLFLKFIVPE